MQENRKVPLKGLEKRLIIVKIVIVKYRVREFLVSSMLNITGLPQYLKLKTV